MIYERSQFTDYLQGPEKSVCLLMVECGIGDDIHAMPTVHQMVQDGYDVTVYGQSFNRPIWGSLGVTFRVPQEKELGLWFRYQNMHTYGRVIGLNQWGIWEERERGFISTDRMQQFAEYVDGSLPKEFSWIEALKPNASEGEYILFAPESAEKWRSLPHHKAYELYWNLCAKHANIIWLTSKPSVTHPERRVCSTFEELRDLVFNAERVVSVENGISNLAAALNVPLTVMCGPTGPEHILDQFTRYIPDFTFDVVLGANPGICRMPCYRSEKNGMEVVRIDNKLERMCCGKYDTPFCMEYMNFNNVVATVTQSQSITA